MLSIYFPQKLSNKPTVKLPFVVKNAKIIVFSFSVSYFLIIANQNSFFFLMVIQDKCFQPDQ